LAEWLAALVCALMLTAIPANAQPPREGPAHHLSCLSYGNAGEVPGADIVATAKWRCDRDGFTLEPEQARLLFRIDAGKPTPRVFATRRSPFERLQLAAIDTDGAVRSRSYAYREVRPAHTGDFVTAQLPPITEKTKYVVAAVDRPTHVMTLQRAHISPGDPGFGPENRALLLGLAALCGMLAMPLMFNLAFYHVLRERFVIWHSVLAFGLLLTIMLNSGLMIYFVPLSISEMSVLSSLVFGLNVAAGSMFARTFIEPDRLDPRLRKLLLAAAMWSIAISSAHAFFPFVLRAHQSQLYYLAYLPVLLLFGIVLADALRRGSRAAKFQLVGWVPLLCVGLIRLIGQLTPLIEPTDAMGLFYVGCVFEVLATTAGVADRFMVIKHERDSARAEANLLERISERDPLTGLLNRRAIEDRFQIHRTEGYTTLAVVDLDHFKAINDTHGHGVGDQVLQAVGTVLGQDENMLAYRLGGEEFVLLLKGKDSLLRAEHHRQAIPARIAQLVPGLDRPVTASMGVIEVPTEVMPRAGFEELYAHADRLLYEAKEGGRNRTVSERMQAFDRRKGDRRRAAAA
jgi:diguanylate cyclase (GGDEF)-like protein